MSYTYKDYRRQNVAVLTVPNTRFAEFDAFQL